MAAEDDTGADEPEPVYWFCNSCGDEVEDETVDCCVNGEIEPAYPEVESGTPTDNKGEHG